MRTDGVPLHSSVDTKGIGRDWIVDANAQRTVYADLVAARNALLGISDCDDHLEIDNYWHSPQGKVESAVRPVARSGGVFRCSRCYDPESFFS